MIPKSQGHELVAIQGGPARTARRTARDRSRDRSGQSGVSRPYLPLRDPDRSAPERIRCAIPLIGMPRNARYVIPGLPHHVTQRGTDRQVVFRSVADRRVYLDLVRECQSDCGVRILAWCLMTNHVHFVVVPEHADSLAVLFRRVHGRYAQYANARHSRSGHLWQARFHSCVLSPRHLSTALRYVEYNPVRAGMVPQPWEYRWSSCAQHLNLEAWDPWLDRPFWQERGETAGWRELLGVADQPQLLYLLRRCTYAERPFGDTAFISEIEERLGQKWRRWPFEIDRALSLDALTAPIA